MAHFSTPVVLIALAGVSVLLALSGPFDTLGALPPLPRLAYWGTIVWLTYGCGTALYLAFPGLDRRPPRPGLFVLVSLLMGMAATVILLIVNYLFLGVGLASLLGLVELFGFAWLVSAILTALSALSGRGRSAQVAQTAKTPRLLARLPVEKRGALVSLSVEDHYVQVTTTKGREMLLMRLRDAIAESEPTPGLRVHRSHWVALSHVDRVVRRGDGARITTSRGEELPVSRSSMSELRASGLLPVPTGKPAGETQTGPR